MPTLSLPEATTPPPPSRPPRAPERRHNGAWKVAYADFVTALMALFIVFWMMNSGDRMKASGAGCFGDPRGSTRNPGAGPSGSGEGFEVQRDNVGDVRRQIEQALHGMPEFARLRDNVQFSVAGEGLRIDLLETEQGMFVVSGSATPTADGAGLLSVLAHEIAALPDALVIEGNTDARPSATPPLPPATATGTRRRPRQRGPAGC